MTGVTQHLTPRERLESDAEGILRQLHKGVPWSTSCVEKLLPPEELTIIGDTRTDAWRQTVKTRVSSVFSSEKKYEILSRTAAPIKHYIKTNNGWSSTGDPYKLAYWYGVELAKELHKVSPHDAMVAMIATVETLNSFLIATKGKRPALNSQMMDKIHRSIVGKRWVQDFGSHGIYFTFKGLAKVDAVKVS